MNKLIRILRWGVLLFFMLAACVSNKELDKAIRTMQEQEETRIASIKEQISAITVSLIDLSNTDTSLKLLIDELEVAKVALDAAIKDNDSKIEQVKEDLSQEASSTKQELLEQLNALKEELQERLNSINLILADLKEKDSALEEQIKSLNSYVNIELKNTKDWAQATFSTLEQYNATVEEIAGIKADIDAVNKSIKELETRIDEKIAADIAEALSALESKIQKLSEDVYAKIAESVEDLKKWVNTQLTSYYTIAEIDERVKLLEKTIKEGDNASAEEIKKLKEELEAQKTSITNAYKTAIQEAISSNNGVIDGKIQAAVTDVNTRITNEVETINEQLSVINNRLNGIDQSIADIMGMIQSIVVIPTYSDGSVALGKGETILYFEVMPLEAAKKLESVALTAFSLKAVSTVQTKADVEFVTLPVCSVEFIDNLVKVKTDGKDVNSNFFNGALSFNARLAITDGLNSITSVFFGMKPRDDVDATDLRIAEYQNKIIDRVIVDGGSAYVVRFVDGSSIELDQHSVVPRVYLDYDGYWTASYDNGESSFRLTDSEDDYIKVDDIESEDVLSVRFLIGNNGKYVYQTYYPSNPEVAISVVNTQLAADPDNSVQAIVENRISNTITITLNNELSFTFRKARVVPTGISVLTNKVRMDKENDGVIEFRINPSNASFNYDVSSNKCEISLDYLGYATKSNYVTNPTNYHLSRIEQVYESDGAKKTGQYRAYISDLGMSTDYDDLVALVLTINDGLGQTAQYSSSSTEVMYSDNLITEFKFMKADNVDGVSEDITAAIYGSNIVINTPLVLDKRKLVASFKTNGMKVFIGSEEQTSGITDNDFTNPLKYTVYSVSGEKNVYTVIVNISNLPLVNIYTKDGVDITSKENYISTPSIAVIQTDGSLFDAADGQIKGRGNMTWTFPKKPYAIKYGKKKKMIATLPEDKSWVLLANYFDETSLRNDLALWMGDELSLLDWTPHYEFVDMFLNDEYKGLYQLGEKVKISKERVNVGDKGVLLEIDFRCVNEDDARYFTVSHLEEPVNIKDPDVEYDDGLYNYAKEYLQATDAVLFSDGFTDPETGWQHYMDIDSFVEWFLIQEISKNIDAGFTSSCYMNLKPGGKLKMGPLWDFDMAFGNYGLDAYNNPEGWWVRNVAWYTRLFEDPVFVARVKERFSYYYNNRQDVYNHIDEYASILKGKVVDDNKIWGRICPSDSSADVVESTYITRIDKLKTWISSRLEWMNEQLASE